jgi:hypothetical protein
MIGNSQGLRVDSKTKSDEIIRDSSVTEQQEAAVGYAQAASSQG